MNVRQQQLVQGLGLVRAAPALRKTEEEELLRALEGRRGERQRLGLLLLPLEVLLKGHIADVQSARVCDVLSERLLAINMIRCERGVEPLLVVLVDEALSAPLELLGSRIRPPTPESAALIELRTLVIKPVGEFMADQDQSSISCHSLPRV